MDAPLPRPGRPSRTTAWLRGLALGTLACLGALHAAPLRLRIDSDPNPLILDPLPQPGAVLVFTAPDLPTLIASPQVYFQTNVALPQGLRLSIPAGPNVGFFRAATWSGVAPVLVNIPAGSFLMGAQPTEAEVSYWEGPPTLVTISRPFLMGKYEVTQAEYQSVMGNNPAYFSGVTNRPVEQVTWTNAMTYCERLTASQQAAGVLPAGWSYRLPTEAEWEYACRGGTNTAFGFGPALRSGMANFTGSQEFDSRTGSAVNPNGVTVGKPTVVGSYPANGWGLHDMHGNVWEWCLDRWSDKLPGGKVTDPQGPSTGTDRLVRGGCFYNIGRICRASYRARGNPVYVGNETGFRIVLAPPRKPAN